MKKWDLFISHAKEDKKDVVEPLAINLERFGVGVWYDTLSLSTGDRLSAAIDKGLKNSIFGLLVISPAFLAKKWPKYEGEFLLQRERVADTMILSLWHNVEYEQVHTWSPELADRLPIRTHGLSPVDIALEIIKVIRPDILTNVHKRVAAIKESAEAKQGRASATDFHMAPFQHQTLPDDLLIRIRLIRASLLNVYPHSFDFWIEGFLRDSHPSENISEWEHICALYQEYISTILLTEEQQHAAFNAILAISFGCSPIGKEAQQLPQGAVKFLSDMFDSLPPIFDRRGEGFSVQGDSDEPGEAMATYFANKDKERFPKDLPDDLLKKFTKENRGWTHPARVAKSRSVAPANVQNSKGGQASKKRISPPHAGKKKHIRDTP
jgi:hypothetical protein